MEPGDTVAVWGCGPVGEFAMLSARLLGADRCIDAVGMESHGYGLSAAYDRAKTALRLETDRACYGKRSCVVVTEEPCRYRVSTTDSSIRCRSVRA
jgi:threonine dehydrogenase-like Zn-dependent dehydrogenase